MARAPSPALPPPRPSKASWDRLPPAQRDAIERAHREVPMAQLRREVRDVEAAMLAAHEKGGGRVVTSTAEQRGQMRERLAPVWAQAVRELGPDGESFFALMEAARKACATAG